MLPRRLAKTETMARFGSAGVRPPRKPRRPPRLSSRAYGAAQKRCAQRNRRGLAAKRAPRASLRGRRRRRRQPPHRWARTAGARALPLRCLDALVFGIKGIAGLAFGMRCAPMRGGLGGPTEAEDGDERRQN